ncbi:tetratricopeptide repeat protein [Acinetobacter sp. A3.8]|uniref:Tetratricopeptide repeat protein n=1 Tax=Acinetobacter sedimenti TaxID=2919922 RepID=A0A9X2B9E9_9GAMM|nr:tetratricopeptide repeat protein [Acinetobacter sedimenti]MCJ8147129.1 tetratricopeptide repeat protein [Acinetobacter sedimenti]
MPDNLAQNDSLQKRKAQEKPVQNRWLRFAKKHSITFLILGSIAYASYSWADNKSIKNIAITNQESNPQQLVNDQSNSEQQIEQEEKLAEQMKARWQANTSTENPEHENHKLNKISLNEDNIFLPVFVAEFALSQDQVEESLTTYQALVNEYNQPMINERALDLALKANDIPRALYIAKVWVDRYPEDTPALFYLAHLSLRAKQYELSAKTLDRILQLDPNANIEGILAGIYPESAEARQEMLNALNSVDKKQNPSLLVMIAGLEAENLQYESALHKVNLALKQRPRVPSFIILKAKLYLASNQESRAMRWLSWKSFFQDTPDVDLYQVQHLLKKNQTDKALRKLRRMVRKYPNHEQLLFLAGITSIDAKQYQNAGNYLKRLQNSAQYQDQANYYLAVSAERNQEIEQAIKLYKAVDGNLYPVARKNLTSLYLKHNRSTEAIQLLTQERVSHPSQSSFLYQLQAQILQSVGNSSQALMLLDEALQQNPNDAELIYSQVLLLDPFKDRDRLDFALNKLLEIEPNSPTFLNAYAYTLAQQNRKLDLARRYAEQALVYAPQQASILDTLGYVAYLQSDYDVAVQALAQAYQLAPSLGIGMRYAKALYIRGDVDRFNQVYRDLKTAHPDATELDQLLEFNAPNISPDLSKSFKTHSHHS